MTDAQRFRLDSDLRHQFEQAKADLSRSRQMAADYGSTLRGLGDTLQSVPENVNPWRREDGEWRWPFTAGGGRLMEHRLPEWQSLKELTDEIRRLESSVEALSNEMKVRGLAER